MKWPLLETADSAGERCGVRVRVSVRGTLHHSLDRMNLNQLTKFPLYRLPQQTEQQGPNIRIHPGIYIHNIHVQCMWAVLQVHSIGGPPSVYE